MPPHTAALKEEGRQVEKFRTFMSCGVVSPGHPSRGCNQMLPPARKRGCPAENTAQPPAAAALGLISSTRSPAYTCHP